jgi:hypothetical protein
MWSFSFSAVVSSPCEVRLVYESVASSVLMRLLLAHAKVYRSTVCMNAFCMAAVNCEKGREQIE